MKPKVMWRKLGLLALASGAAAYGRVSIMPLQEAVRAGLSLTDSQMGVVQGPAIALPFLLVSFPLGLAIDRASRVRLLLFLLICESCGCLLTALAGRFAHLALARGLVGLAWLAINPVVLSLVGDLYEPSRRGRALMITGFAQLAATAAAFGLGGVVLTLSGAGPEGWRRAMLWLTVPFLPAIAAIWNMREPGRSERPDKAPSVKTSLFQFWSSRAVVLPVLFGIAAMELTIMAVTTWAAPALMRTYAIGADRVGMIMAATMIVSGICGPLAGGTLADRFQRAGGPGRTLLLVSVLGLLAAPAGLFPLIHQLPVAAGVLVLFVTLVAAICVMGVAVFTVVIPATVRGLGASMLSTVATITVGLAPVMVSGLSSSTGISIQTSLAAVGTGITAIAAAIFAAGIRRVPMRRTSLSTPVG